MRESPEAKWTEVKIPRLGPNDELALLVAWNAASGERVVPNQPVAVIETSKAAQDLEATVEGYLYPLSEAGTQVRVQDTIALILPSPNPEAVAQYRHQLAQIHGPSVTASSDMPPGVRLTKKAAELARQAGIDFSQLPRGRILRETDIRPLVAAVQQEAPDIGVDAASSGPAILVVGGGGLGRMCIETIRSMGGYTIAGVLDANLPLGHDVLGVPVVGSDQEMSAYRERGVPFACNAVGALTVPSPRTAVYQRLKAAGFFLPNIIHPRAVVSPSARLGEGCIIEANAVVGAAVRVGNNCIINTHAVVSHDCRLGDHVHIAPGAVLAGDVTVGEHSIVGMGVTVYMGVSIGRDVVVQNGQNVFADVPDGRTVR